MDLRLITAMLKNKLPESLTAQMAKAMQTTAKKILFVEDDENFLNFISELAKQQFDLCLVCSGRTAEASEKLETEDFDAAILDVRVTNGNGINLYRKIIDRWPYLQVIFLTGYDTPQLREQIEQIGPARIYSKDSMMKPEFFDNLMNQLGVTKHNAMFEPERLSTV